MIEVIQHFIKIQNRQTLIVLFATFLATYTCLQMGFVINIPTGLIGTAVIFPIVFSINAAYRRREEALRHFASLKAHAIALYYAHRDWPPNDEVACGQEMSKLIARLLQQVAAYLTTSEDETKFQTIYDTFSDMSKAMESLRGTGVPANEVSRTNQYLRALMIEFERMCNIRHYRTPRSLRAYSYIFLNAFPILFAPYFAYLSQESFFVGGFLVAAFYSIILVSLDNIQEDLENPFDRIGDDDLNLNIVGRYMPLWEVDNE